MNAIRQVPFIGTSSAPTDDRGSGAGSVMAVIVSHGVAISRHTPEGSYRPFGLDTGTADDNTLLEQGDVVSYADAPEGTAG
jgi:hypothetical protein